MGENEHFSPGNEIAIFELDYVRCGIAVCYDGRFPEWIRRIALQGISILFLPAACYRDGLEAGILLDDESAWGAYRWDYFSYPHCTGPLRCADLFRASSVQTDTPQQKSDEAEKNP